MHPAFYSWWKHARGSSGSEGHGGCGHEAHAEGHCGPGFGRGGHSEGGRDDGHGHGPRAWASRFGGGDEGAGFGVRRPLRFLAHRLDLTEEQVGSLARILNELKTERAQAEVDNQRTVTAFADAIEADAFDAARADEGSKLRLASAERLKSAVQKALAGIHGVLTKEQREKFAYLVRTGVVSM
jgi:Spy/CpxP family protein refolding chaperone